MPTTEELVVQDQKIIDDLRVKTNATRTTVRLDSDKHGWFVNGIVAESLGAGAMSLRKETGLQQRRSGTATWLEQNRQILVQNDTVNACTGASERTLHCLRDEGADDGACRTRR